MLATSTAAKTDFWEQLQDRVIPLVVLLYQIIGLVALAILPILAVHWIRLPFIGAFVEQTMLVNTVSPSRAGAWVVHQQISEFGYQLSSINGVPVRNTQELERELSRYQTGDIVEIVFKDLQGETESYDVQLGRLPITDQLAFFYLPYLIGLVYMISSLWVFVLRRWDATGRAFSVFATSIAIAMAGLFDIYTTHRLTSLWTVSVAMSAGSLLTLALLFPGEFRPIERHPYLRWTGFLPGIVLALFALKDLYNFSQPQAYVNGWRLEFIICGFAFLFFLACTGYRLVNSQSPIVREQSRLILLGTVTSFGLLIIWFFATLLAPEIRFTPLILLPIIVFPIINAYIILRYRLLKAQTLMARTTLYIFLIALTSVGYALLVSGLSLLLDSRYPNLNPIITGASIFVFALLFHPLRLSIQRWIDDTFAKSHVAYREALQAFSRELTEVAEFSTITNLLRGYIERHYHPSQFHIFIKDSLSDHYTAVADKRGKPTTDLLFQANSPLIQALSHRRAAIYLAETNSLPTALQPERARLALLGAQLFIPLPGRKSLAGWMALGLKSSGEPYGDQDLGYMESLCDQAALAIERTQVVTNLERRMHEMDVLIRVAQGINVTLAFDDILELIYAQTIQLIPSNDFHVTLRDQEAGYLYHVFCVENDERLNEHENQPLPPGLGLEADTVSHRALIVTEDYDGECRNRGILPAHQGPFAWAGVPLNAGAETIGLISIASRDPSITYSVEQMNILRAISDQAAGAIVKAQLFQESERRARQLGILNEIARSLTSTLSLKPLLNQILQSAVNILDCEAGSLLLVDEQTDDLVFEVAAGPVASTLLGQHMPPGIGLAGQAVEKKQPIIANDARRNKAWFEKPDAQTGFVTQDILVVPLEVKDHVIGVIEVINKNDGRPLTKEDQELLSAFSSQAAIAIENARLYTLTDQALNARVEELSIMQRIDRELNTSLEVERSMRITLHWALHQSGANAGLIGLVETDLLRIFASEGYPDLAGIGDTYQPLVLPAVKEAFQTGQPKMLAANSSGDHFGLLENAEGLVAVPIRRESKVIGLMMLEFLRSTECPPEILGFLSRLSDHAAIAISNAQLYTAVEAANIAKSEFVSFVSHELKTPMTSIKGFADLLAAGVVGPINENQANFLSTIRSNVDRMATLVSDLADVSRIEAGRLKLDFAAIPVSEVAGEVIRSIQRQVDEKRQTLTLQIPPDLPPVWGDRVRLIQILTNLVSNAYKYSPTGGRITVCAELSPSQRAAGVPVPNGAHPPDEASTSPRVIHISVQDTGYGISAEDQKKIFLKFFRSEDQNVRDTPGTGLGLNITRTLVEMQGGAIWFISEIKKGTTFHFTIPVAESN